MHTFSRQIGSRYEQCANRFLQSRGLLYLDSNFNRRIGEIDLVMCDPGRNQWVFVEVRYRSTSQFGGAISSITQSKQRRLVKTANAYLQKYSNANQAARIDVVTLEKHPTVSSSIRAVSFEGLAVCWYIDAIQSD